MILRWLKLEVIACFESFPTIAHMPNSAENQESYDWFTFRPIESGEGARSGPQRNLAAACLKARPMASGHLARSGGTTNYDTGDRCPIGPGTEFMLALSVRSGGSRLTGSGGSRSTGSGGGALCAVLILKRVFLEGGIHRCPNTPFIVFFIIIHRLEGEKAIERVLERFCNLSWIFIDS